MSRLHSLWFFICRHKYAVVIISILLMVCVVDENSYLNRYQRWIRLDNLRSEITKYKAQYDEADNNLKQLESNPRAIEKLAREKYYMKRANEDVFVVQEAAQQEPDSVVTN